MKAAAVHASTIVRVPYLLPPLRSLGIARQYHQSVIHHCSTSAADSLKHGAQEMGTGYAKTWMAIIQGCVHSEAVGRGGAVSHSMCPVICARYDTQQMTSCLTSYM